MAAETEAAAAGAEATFSVLVLTAPPAGQLAEAGGAFAKIDGREALLRSVELFLNRDNIPQIQVVIQPEAMDEAKRKYGPHLSFSGVKLIVGGPKWMNQIGAAKDKINPDCTHVIVHDGARPIVPYSDIDALLDAAARHPAVGLATPVRTPLVELDEGGNPRAFHLPTHYMHLLTPQAFSMEKFRQMATTETELHASESTLVKGSPLNIRVGGAGEGSMAKAMLNMLPKPKVKPPSSPFEEAQW